MYFIVDEYGVDGVLSRLSDPFFFQSLSNVLGFDWNSSGTTTVLCGVLQEVFNREEYGLKVVGGKGLKSRKTQKELVDVADKYSLTEKNLSKLQYSSQITAKVDSAGIQAGYRLYHHSMFVSEHGMWAVVQQGMNPEHRTARRFHWLSDHIQDFVEEPHEGIVGDKTHDFVLDLTSRESRRCRKTIADLATKPPAELMREFESIKPGQRTLVDYDKPLPAYDVPSRVNWSSVERAYELQPNNFEGLLMVEGVGPATVRGLALVAELVYGEPPSWRDPVKYSFAFGGKDGVPFPVRRREYDQAIQVLEEAVRQSRLGDFEKTKAIQRLKNTNR